MNCTYIPSKGVDLFRSLKKQFGYDKATDIFLRVISPRFIQKYGKTLSLDAEGIPSFEAVMNNSWVKKFVGDQTILESLNKNFTAIEDTRDNFNVVLEEAYRFNNESPYRNDYIATVEYTKDNKLIVQVSNKTADKVDKFNNQYGIQKLNKSLSQIFTPLGVTIDNLSYAETKAGRVGNIDFSKAKEIASGFKSMIRVANNLEGEKAISEEFSHLLIALFKNEALVSRAFNTLRNNEEAVKKILGDTYQDVYDFYDGDVDLIAEEALGHVLQNNLLSNVIKNENTSLFRRAIDSIVKKFKPFKTSDVDKAIQEADNAMNTLAKQILTNSLQVTQEDIARINRNDSFNALSERVEKNIKILKEAIKVEQKRLKINFDVSEEHVKNLVNELRRFSGEDSDTIKGLSIYAEEALKTLKGFYESITDIGELSIGEKCAFLRKVQQYLQSYGSFIKALSDLYNDERTLDDSIFSVELSTGITLGSILSELNDINTKLSSDFKKHSISTFAEFAKPYLENTDIAIGELIQTATDDIGFMDRWLDSMGNSSDVMLQVFDSVVKKAKDNARTSTIKSIQSIQAWMQKAESLGYTTFDWMFETNSEGKKTGNYISETNIGEYEYQLDKFMKELDEKYGKNPSGDKAKQKIAERNAWLNKYTYSYYGRRLPKPAMWKNNAYYSLSKEQRELLKEYKDIKSKLDKLIPENKLTSNLAVQIRKSAGQRFIESATSPSALFENIKNSFKSSFLDSADDDQIFGATVRKGFTNYDGTEYMILPVQYTNRLENPEELSTDVVGTLMSYAYMCHQYHNLEQIVNPLEIGRTIVKEYRNTKKTRGGNPLVEKVESMGDKVYNDIMHSDGTNIQKKLDDFMESQVYQRYIKDEGVILGNVNVAKAVNKMLEWSSMAQLGFNWLANIANVTQGICMQHIESAAGQYFTFTELLAADKEYTLLMKDFVPEIGSRIQNNKLSLLGDFFNLKQDFNRTVRRTNKKNILERVFGANIAFLGQEAGDHWLYYRTAIAHMKHTKIKVGDKVMTVWDALKIRDAQVGNGIKEMYMLEAYNLDGTKFDPHKFGRQIAHINQNLFGIYNDDDANAASRVALGRLLIQYRKWMKPLYNRRFQKKQFNLEMGVDEEGYYRTLIRVIQELRRGEIQFSMLKDQLTEADYQNIKRALFEIGQFLCVLGAAEFIDWPDDKDRPWALKLAEYSTHRLAHELGGLTPSPAMINETLKTVKTPMAMLSTIQNTANLATSLLDPRDWVDEMQSGPYEGLSTLEKNFIKAPLPVVAQFRQIQKFTDDLDTSIMYYLRPY